MRSHTIISDIDEGYEENKRGEHNEAIRTGHLSAGRIILCHQGPFVRWGMVSSAPDLQSQLRGRASPLDRMAREHLV